MKEFIKNNLIFRKYYGYNLYNRDKWVEKQANLIKNGSKILDVGAGSSPYRGLFSHCEYKTHDFIQLNDEQLRGRKGYGKIDYVSDIISIPVEDNSFDAVLCTEVFEHIPYPIQALEEISRLLKKGGVLILTAPLGSGLHQVPYHFYGGYTPYWYEKFLNDNKYKSILIEPNMGFYSLFAQEHLRFLRRNLPWKSLVSFLMLPLWLIMLPLGFLLPLLAPLLDKTSVEKDFTLGYHVSAIKE
jgi:ubiquinone/menaquinone biosynthesis C-methylase UbiE